MPKKAAKSVKKSLQIDPCQVCFDQPRAKGVYRRIQGKAILLYEACSECHARVVENAKDFGFPEWGGLQKDLEREHKGTAE